MERNHGSGPHDQESANLKEAVAAIRQSLVLLQREIGDDKTTSRAIIIELHTILMDILWQPGEDIGCDEIRHVIMNTRGRFWDAILGAPNPRRAFVRWLKHLDDVTTGRVQCQRFTKIRKSE